MEIHVIRFTDLSASTVPVLIKLNETRAEKFEHEIYPLTIYAQLPPKHKCPNVA